MDDDEDDAGGLIIATDEDDDSSSSSAPDCAEGKRRRGSEDLPSSKRMRTAAQDDADAGTGTGTVEDDGVADVKEEASILTLDTSSLMFVAKECDAETMKNLRATCTTLRDVVVYLHPGGVFPVCGFNQKPWGKQPSGRALTNMKRICKRARMKGKVPVVRIAIDSLVLGYDSDIKCDTKKMSNKDVKSRLSDFVSNFCSKNTTGRIPSDALSVCHEEGCKCDIDPNRYLFRVQHLVFTFGWLSSIGKWRVFDVLHALLRYSVHDGSFLPNLKSIRNICTDVLDAFHKHHVVTGIKLLTVAHAADSNADVIAVAKALRWASYQPNCDRVEVNVPYFAIPNTSQYMHAHNLFGFVRTEEYCEKGGRLVYVRRKRLSELPQVDLDSSNFFIDDLLSDSLWNLWGTHRLLEFYHHILRCESYCTSCVRKNRTLHALTDVLRSKGVTLDLATLPLYMNRRFWHEGMVLIDE